MAYLSDIEIAQQCEMKPIMEIAKKAMPMIGLFLVALLLFTFIPAFSLALI